MNLHSKYLMFFYDSSLHLNAKEWNLGYG
jgi:hypothetical protein